MPLWAVSRCRCYGGGRSVAGWVHTIVANRNGRHIVADASQIESDAAIDSLVERGDADPGARALKRYEHRYQEFKTGKRRRKLANQAHVCASDADAALVSGPGAHEKLSYTAHFSADAGSRIITDCLATAGARHECPILFERIEYQRDEWKRCVGASPLPPLARSSWNENGRSKVCLGKPNRIMACGEPDIGDSQKSKSSSS